MQPCPPTQPPLASGGCRRLRCFSAGGVTSGLIICGFKLFIYFPPCYVALCASKAWHRFGSEKVSWCLETSLFLRLPSRDRAPSLPLLSLFLSYIFFPTFFRRHGLLFWVPNVLCRHQKLFCGIYSAFKRSFDEFVGEKVFSLSYSSTILAPPLSDRFYKKQIKRVSALPFSDLNHSKTLIHKHNLSLAKQGL